jgi:hypothetical protein
MPATAVAETRRSGSIHMRSCGWRAAWGCRRQSSSTATRKPAAPCRGRKKAKTAFFSASTAARCIQIGRSPAASTLSPGELRRTARNRSAIWLRIRKLRESNERRARCENISMTRACSRSSISAIDTARSTRRCSRCLNISTRRNSTAAGATHAVDMLPAGVLASLWVDIDASVGPAEASGDLSNRVDCHIRAIEDWLHGLEVVHLSEE